MVMRRFDVWVGRVAAIVGILYVVLASLWPLTASAGEPGSDAAQASWRVFAGRDEATIERLPLETALVDIRVAGVIAEVVGRRDRTTRATRTRRRSTACAAFASDDGFCAEASTAALLPDGSTLTVLAIPVGVLALAAASTLRVRRPLTA